MWAPCLKFWWPVANPRHLWWLGTRIGSDLEKILVIQIFDLISDFSKETHPLSRQPRLQYCSRSERPSYPFSWCFSAMKPTTYIIYVCMLWFYFLKTVELMHDFILLPVYLISRVDFLNNSSFFLYQNLNYFKFQAAHCLSWASADWLKCIWLEFIIYNVLPVVRPVWVLFDLV